MRLMNLPAELVLDIVKQVFVERRLCTGRLTGRGQSVVPGAINRTGLMTIEAQNDDIAAPGQTYAAHALCCSIPDNLRRHLLLPGSGHFSCSMGTHGARACSLRFYSSLKRPRRAALPVESNVCSTAALDLAVALGARPASIAGNTNCSGVSGLH